ncbi:unnamed protein product [Larinioides sclopetarius]|uniref:Uncharacterized protein n=1 Tax=Larinioides sclopetarius TaxID=280406 RepID=A0AAV2BLI7_9ARAC
MHRSSDQSV